MITPEEARQWQLEEWAIQEAFDLKLIKAKPWLIDEVRFPNEEMLSLNKKYLDDKKLKRKEARERREKRIEENIKKYTICSYTMQWMEFYGIQETPRGNQEQTATWIKRVFGRSGLKYALKHSETFDQLVEILEDRADELVTASRDEAVYTY